MAGVSWLGRVHHNIHASLPYYSGAQLGGDGLLQHGHHPRVHVDHLSIASSDATLSHVHIAVTGKMLDDSGQDDHGIKR